MPVETGDQTTRTRTVRMTASPFVTVEHVLAFADRLRKEKIPPRTRIDEDHAHETRHLVGLSVRVTEQVDPPDDPEG